MGLCELCAQIVQRIFLIGAVAHIQRHLSRQGNRRQIEYRVGNGHSQRNSEVEQNGNVYVDSTYPRKPSSAALLRTLLALPRAMGVHPHTGKTILTGIGGYGPSRLASSRARASTRFWRFSQSHAGDWTVEHLPEPMQRFADPIEPS